MSTVVGIVKNGGVWIGADSAATTEEGEKRPVVAKKIFRNGKYLIGYIGSVRGGQILHPKFFTPPEDILFLPDYIRRHCQDCGCITLSNQNQTEIHMCNFLVGFENKLYEILVDFQMNEIPEYDAIGSGSSYAFGVFYETRNKKLEPEQRIKKALEASAFFDLATAPPFVIEKL